jgi:hypothetical protein
MDDALGMGFGNCVASLEDVVYGLRNGEWTVVAELARKIVTIEVLKHHVRRPIIERSDVEDARNVLATKTYGGASLAYESTDVRRGCRTQHELDRDELAEREVPRSNDDAHPAGTEDTLNAVFVEEVLPGLETVVHGDLGSAGGRQKIASNASPAPCGEA